MLLISVLCLHIGAVCACVCVFLCVCVCGCQVLGFVKTTGRLLDDHRDLLQDVAGLARRKRAKTSGTGAAAVEQPPAVLRSG